MSAIEKIKSIEDAYGDLGLNQKDECPFPEPKNGRQIAANSFMDAMVLTEALNEGQIPDFDSNERKYEIWWNMRSKAAGGAGFSYDDCSYDFSFSRVGARLVFKSRELAEYAGKHFPEVYKPFMTFQEFTDVPKG